METLTHHIWIGFAVGLLGFAHCLGMCGGFAVHLSQGKERNEVVITQLLWLAGKLFSYLFLGAVAGFAGAYLSTLLLHRHQFQDLLSFAAGAVILLMGLNVLGLVPVRKNAAGSFLDTVLGACGRNLLATPTPGSALALGLVTGLLPCPIVFAFLAYSLQTGSVLTGMVTMGALGLGTSLPLLLLGGISRLSGIHLRSWAPRAGGIILVVLGLTTVLRGTTLYHHLLGCPANAAPQSVAADPSKPFCTGEPHGNRSGN